MAQSPVPISPWPGVSDPLSLVDSNEFAAKTDAESPEAVFASLVEQIASGTTDLDVLLGKIAKAAQLFTHANGAALGMRRDGIVVCVGRSGETAPALGAKLSEDSGISGACLRTGQTLRCDDTETDLRVNAEVCRHLGLRSIAAAPIRSKTTTIGILEIFSTSADAFSDEHIGFLSSLAELADIANSAQEQDAAFQPTNITGAESPASPTLPDPLPASIFWPPQEASPKNKWRYYAIAGGGIVLAGLLSAAGWRAWQDIRQASSREPVTNRPSQVASQPESLSLNLNESARKPTPQRITDSSSKNNNTSKGVVQASSVEDDVLIRKIEDRQPASAPATNASTAQPSAAQADSSSSEAPQVTIASSNDQALNGLLPSTAATPQLDVRVSQGVTPLVLKKKVVPIYPKQALFSRVEGVVLMQASINDKGRVEKIKLVSGPALLGKAAMDAVKQWEYEPAALNGKPVPIETEITLKFKLP